MFCYALLCYDILCAHTCDFRSLKTLSRVKIFRSSVQCFMSGQKLFLETKISWVLSVYYFLM